MTHSNIFEHIRTDDPTDATIELDLSQRLSDPVDPNLYGKFTEHLGRNIYGGMDAQILFNPTFGAWKFKDSRPKPSGGYAGEYDPDKIRERLDDSPQSISYLTPYNSAPIEEADVNELVSAFESGLAFGWRRVGREEDVRCSPDSGPSGNRAQRIQISPGSETATGGIYQETCLPLHRTRTFRFRCKIRAVEPITLSLTLRTADSAPDHPLVETALEVDAEWATINGTLEVSREADVSDDEPVKFALTASDDAHVILERILLYPDDHVDRADPEIVRLLRESNLPLLRWPGGNFVSGYHWRDGIGPIDSRPTRRNPAWDGLEYNLFGTDEFLVFCENVGCEPMICVNAGSGTPEEAAAWVEYCNGSTETEMGALRAEHGHPEPYAVNYWEIGNELWGKWQVHWTTPEGNADRYRRFYEAMTAVDPDIDIVACGISVTDDSDWNDPLLGDNGTEIRSLSDHILAGGQISRDTDPDELYHAYMGFSDQIGAEYRTLRKRMRNAGVDDPKLALTELQIYPKFKDEGSGSLTRDTIPTPKTISEALYHATIVHECIRLGGFVEMLTHSALVNHGGGLQKRRQRTWADPVYYGRKMGMQLTGGTPIGVTLSCDTISTERTFREIDPVDAVPSLDAMAVLSADESRVTLMIVNRASRDHAVSLTIDTGGFDARSSADVRTLAGTTMDATNTRTRPDRVTPRSTTVAVDDGRCSLMIEPYSLTQITFRTDGEAVSE